MIHNQDEFDAARETIDEVNCMARELYMLHVPHTEYPRILHSTEDPMKERYWDLACDACEHFTGTDARQLLDELNDALREQIDPCGAAKARDLAA